MLALAWSAALLAASAPVMASILGRQPEIPASCAGLPQGSLGSLSYNFTLSAYNLDKPNANSTGVPLVLALGPPGTSAAASEWVIATQKTAGSDDWPYWTMVNGVLTPQPGPNEQGLGAYASTVDQGDVPAFIVTIAESDPNPADIYCGADESDEYLVLSVNNNPDGFSLCTATDDYDQNVVVYEAEQSNSAYSYDTCYAVHIYIVPYTA
ncbi:uncharacterized protein C8Q71DRAFT_423582 [Rhodofomes roseus]|uniref:Uncharacterized protein n=1 Tax=Rhodofomes roseus TaxID=34475 RepID=A0ABQ8KR15_9APHY|nr:uncharacterized protein C8Q71DRAFT_423582 [Rhodofomes roseus]KAH9840794.1 hypothetical protein C8Q71DRAFT_423582 [Rhodofomes roseus]